MELSSFSLPFEIFHYSIYISQFDNPNDTHTYIRFDMTTKDGKIYESRVSEWSEDKIPLPEHLEQVKNKIIDEINKKIEEDKKISTKQDEDKIIDITTDSCPPKLKTKKCRSCKKKSKTE